MPHTFEHDGVTVTVFPEIVKTRLTRGRLITKLLAAHSHVVENPQDGQTIVSDDVFDNFLEHAGHLAQSQAAGAAWWVDEHASLDAVRAAHDAFLNADAELFDLLRAARSAVKPPKKTAPTTSKT